MGTADWKNVIPRATCRSALICGIAAILIASEGELSVASLVGFVMLFGIAAQDVSCDTAGRARK